MAQPTTHPSSRPPEARRPEPPAWRAHGVVERASDRSVYVTSAVVSVIALAVIAYILLLRDTGGAAASGQLAFMPAINASLNALSAAFLSAGWVAIRRRVVHVHRALMIAALVASALFLVGYLTYHYVHGDTPYRGQGWLRGVYFAVLISHVVLSMVVLPMAIVVLAFALRGTFVRHRRLARIALPIWLYVSVTGVLIYFMLRADAAALP